MDEEVDALGLKLARKQDEVLVRGEDGKAFANDVCGFLFVAEAQVADGEIFVRGGKVGKFCHRTRQHGDSGAEVVLAKLQFGEQHVPDGDPVLQRRGQAGKHLAE